MFDAFTSLPVFIQVAENGSLAEAARNLGITSSAVGKRISRLEEKIGAQLFRRTTRTISLTHEGEILLERSRYIINELNDIKIAISKNHEELKGTLRISLAHVSDVLLDHISKFNIQYPDIKFELDYTDRIVDLVGEGYDVAIRVGHIPDSNLRTHHLGYFYKLIVASPAYLNRYGEPKELSELYTHKLLHYRSENTGIIEKWPINTKLIDTDNHPKPIICNDINARIIFALKGLGIAYLPDITIHQYLESGQLKPILKEHTMEKADIHLVWSYAKSYTARQMAFINFMKSTEIPIIHKN